MSPSNLLAIPLSGPRSNSVKTIVIALSTLLAIGQIALAQQDKPVHNSASSLNNEQSIPEPSHRRAIYNGGDQANAISKSPAHEDAIVGPGRLDSLITKALHTYEQNDPFAATFDDYYKDPTINSSFSLSSIPDSAGLIIEDEDNLIQQQQQQPTPNIDFIFPPSEQEVNQHKPEAKFEALAEKDAEEKPKVNSSNKPLVSDQVSRLLFAWRQILSNKCSKTCGKGYRLNHLYCIDLKYKVRVEDELCAESNRPNEISDEPCNEMDCPPQWSSTQFTGCSSSATDKGKCDHNELYKKVECTMVNRDGQTVTLASSRCNGSVDNSPTTSAPEQMGERVNQDLDQVEFNLQDQSSDNNNEKNDILFSIDSASESLNQVVAMHGSESKPTKVYPINEPFYETGNWSECIGAPCGELGKRTRKLSCRLYLSRSSKFVELQDAHCHNSHIPDTHEPCYMDCQSPSENSNSLLPVDMANYTVGENTDEIVYDLEMSRFVWRREGWTKCSADCLGGRRESIIECWDRIAQTLVDQSLCLEEFKPSIVTEICNKVACQPEWRLEPFSKCTKSCGSAGIRSRSIACVQQVPLQEGSSTLIVSNDLCIQTNGSVPHQLEPCGRIDCRPEWKVGPWSECSKKCGEGVRNRTVICVQEFAHKEGPRSISGDQNHHQHQPSTKTLSPDLIEAITVSAKDWHPGKATQVSFHECYKEYKTVPQMDERCFKFCEKEPYIDADTNQDYHMTQDSIKRKTISLKIGGKAQLREGRNLKLRCKIHHDRDNHLVNRKSTKQIEWRKDGVKIFSNGSTMADKLSINDDNMILGGDVLSDDRNQFMADDPFSNQPLKSSAPTNPNRQHKQAANLNTRSWSSNLSQPSGSQGNFHFVAQKGGRFSLIKENTLRIKRLKPDDSGLYTCSYGSLSESIDLQVVSRQELINAGNKEFANNLNM